MIPVPQILNLTENCRIYFIQGLKLVKHYGKMTINRLPHDDFKQIAKICQFAIDMYSQLFFETALKLTAKHSLAVTGNKKVCRNLSFQCLGYQRCLSDTPPSHKNRKHGRIFCLSLIFQKNPNFIFPVVKTHNVNYYLYK